MITKMLPLLLALICQYYSVITGDGFYNNI